MPIILKKSYLLDTNILIYSLDKKSFYFKKSSEILRLCFNKQITGLIAQQNLLELANILINTYKISRTEVIKDINLFVLELNLKVIFPGSKTITTFLKLLKKSKKEKEVFDLYLAATMIDNQVENILTRNIKDFAGIEEIQAINPF